MIRFVCLVLLCAAHVSCYPRHEESEARVLSEVWEAMDKHRGDDIIVIPRRDESEYHSGSDHRSSEHNGPRHDGPSHDGPSHDGPSHDGPGHDGSSHDGPSDRSESERSSDTENTNESEKSESSSESSDTSAAESSPSSESPEKSSEESSRGHGSFDESSYDRMWSKFNRLGDMMNRAVDRLRKDDREILELENGSSSGLTVFILEIVGAVVVGLIVVGLLIFGLVKGLRGIKIWKARRQSERLVDQEAPNMDGTGYQSGYNP